MDININNLVKYVILFCVVAGSTFYIPNCNIINEHAVYIGLLASTTFAILDRFYPSVIIENYGKNHKDHY
jgi:hypothetical protein